MNTEVIFLSSTYEEVYDLIPLRSLKKQKSSLHIVQSKTISGIFYIVKFSCTKLGLILQNPILKRLLHLIQVIQFIKTS